MKTNTHANMTELESRNKEILVRKLDHKKTRQRDSRTLYRNTPALKEIMQYLLFFVSLALLSRYVPGYLIVQDNDSSSEGERELSLKQRLDNLEESLANLQENTQHRTNCSGNVSQYYY